MKKIMALLAASLFSVSAQAGFWTGNDLLQKIDSKESVERAMAYGYIAGVYDLGSGLTHCPPDNVILRQVLDIVRRELAEKPELRHQAADLYVVSGLQAVWPCKKRGEKTL